MARPHIEHIHRDEVAPGALPATGWPAVVMARALSSDPDSGALSAILHLSPGWQRPEGHVLVDVDLFVLEGALAVGQVLRGDGYYEYAPAGAAQAEWRVGSAGADVLLLSPRGAPDFVEGPGSCGAEGRIEIDTAAMRWAPTVVPGPPPGMFIKLLRHAESSGEGVFLASTVPHYEYAKIEYHDCVEEAYMIDGDIWLGNSGLMSKGRYFWRPPYIAHGPFFSTAGMLALFTIDSPLVNHFVDDPRRTIEENRAEALAQGGPVDYMGKAVR